jgi:hypothetical protein
VSRLDEIASDWRRRAGDAADVEILDRRSTEADRMQRRSVVVGGEVTGAGDEARFRIVRVTLREPS